MSDCREDLSLLLKNPTGSLTFNSFQTSAGFGNPPLLGMPNLIYFMKISEIDCCLKKDGCSKVTGQALFVHNRMCVDVFDLIDVC